MTIGTPSRYRGSAVRCLLHRGFGVEPLTSALVMGGLELARLGRIRGNLELEIEAGAAIGSGLDAQVAAHRGDQPATDREAEPRAGERTRARELLRVERLEQTRDDLIGNPGSAVAHGELHPRR